MAHALSFVNRIRIAPVVAAMFAVAAATLVALMPPAMFGRLAASAGLEAVLAALGPLARALAALVAGGIVGAAIWALATLLERVPAARTPSTPEDEPFDLAPYSAPPRSPIFADRELGAPLMSEEALVTAAPAPAADDIVQGPELEHPDLSPEQAAPADPPVVEPEAETPALDAPLAIEELVPPPSTEADEPREGEPSIEALIRRLEAGLARRDTPRPPTPAAPPAPSQPTDRPSLRAVATRDDETDPRRAFDALRRIAGR